MDAFARRSISFIATYYRLRDKYERPKQTVESQWPAQTDLSGSQLVLFSTTNGVHVNGLHSRSHELLNNHEAVSRSRISQLPTTSFHDPGTSMDHS